jgi:hypothetical protein
MIAVVLAGMLGLASPPAPCKGADISVTDLRIKLVKGTPKTGTLDRVLITADMTNIGDAPQRPHLQQHAELMRDGMIVATQSFPALAAGVTYPLQFRLFRNPGPQSSPLEVLVRYVLDTKSPAATSNCSAANDSLQKTF